MLQLTAEQKKQLATLQSEVDTKLAKILTEEQKKQLKEMRPPGFGGPGGFGPPGGPGGKQPPGGGFPPSPPDRPESLWDASPHGPPGLFGRRSG
jgi:hypothetical protein